MAAPDNRVPVRIARGTKATLDANVADLYEGEIVYATDENVCYVLEGGVLVAASAGAGSIDELSDVDTSTAAPTDGQALVWSDADSEWKPGTVESGGGGITRIQDASDFGKETVYATWLTETESTQVPNPGEWNNGFTNTWRMNPVDSNGRDWTDEMNALGTAPGSTFWYSTDKSTWVQEDNDTGSSSQMPNRYVFGVPTWSDGAYVGPMYISFVDPATPTEQDPEEGMILRYDATEDEFQPFSFSRLESVQSVNDLTGAISLSPTELADSSLNPDLSGSGVFFFRFEAATGTSPGDGRVQRAGSASTVYFNDVDFYGQDFSSFFSGAGTYYAAFSGGEEGDWSSVTVDSSTSWSANGETGTEVVSLFFDLFLQNLTEGQLVAVSLNDLTSSTFSRESVAGNQVLAYNQNWGAYYPTPLSVAGMSGQYTDLKNRPDATRLRQILDIKEFVDDAAAGAGGLTTGAMYFNTTSSDYRLKS